MNAQPLTVSELADHLFGMMREDRAAGALPITFGPDATPVSGGIVKRGAETGRYLNLAPMPLNKVGGF